VRARRRERLSRGPSEAASATNNGIHPIDTKEAGQNRNAP
jgi:hypothetical protein